VLGQATFGEYAFLYSTVLAVGTVAQFGTGLTATKYIAEFRSADPARAGRILTLCRTVTLGTGFSAGLLLFAAAPWIADAILRQPHLTAEVRLAAGFIWFSVMMGVQNGALAGLERYRSLARATALHAPLHMAVCLAGAWRWGLSGAVGGLVVSVILRWMILEVVLRREAARAGLGLGYGVPRQEATVIGRFALPAAISGLSTMPAQWAATALLVSSSGGHLEMALFAAANNLRNLVLFLPALINGVGVSLLNHARRGTRPEGYRRLFWTNLAATSGVTVLGAVGIAVLGMPLLRLYGPGFQAGYGALLLLLLGAALDGAGLGLYQIIQVRERMWLSLFLVALPRDLLLVGLGYLLVTSHGAQGLATAFAASSALGLAVTAGLVARLGLAPRAYAEGPSNAD
ncbi:MAG: oligosaccharide flippase family protein, partial [Gammaproteobacteria bacterium]